MKRRLFSLGLTPLLAASLVLGGCAAGTGKQVLSTDKVYPAIGPYSQMVGYGNLLFISGVIPLNAKGDAVMGTTTEEQTRIVLDYIGTKLRSQGLGYADVLSSTVYMKDLNEFPLMNRVYGEYFKTDAPVRATVEVARLPRDVRTETAVIAGRR